MITVVFDKLEAEKLLNRLRQRLPVAFGPNVTLHQLLCLAGACWFISSEGRAECGHCGGKGDTLELVRHMFVGYGVSPDLLQGEIERAVERLPVEDVSATIELYGHLFDLVANGEYDSTYERTVSAVILLGWHGPGCNGGAHDPEDEDFCGCYPEDRQVVFLQGVRQGEAPSTPDDERWRGVHVPVIDLEGKEPIWGDVGDDHQP